MFCGKCGKSLAEGTKFCGGCGEEQLAKVASAQEAVVQAVQPPRSQVDTSQLSYVAPQQQSYRAPQSVSGDLSVGDYIGMMLLMGIPILNLILLLVWGFGGSTNTNKKNFARAYLVIGAIIVALWIILIVIIAASGGALMRSLSRSMYY